ncbi:proline-rich receptor-like protein kinase PERK10 [Spinacia oleracea]|uniref:Proline-rich receptor-like protein kinase PERK10 n=1 Tax=Spinacia oleracea TaxID=3562 RepID=A0ABM3R8K7_SPIOL|nr:proline-rich receptor-like protein kinase PERK10 [Spinacia oleracea]
MAKGFQYRRDTSTLNRRLDLDAAPDHPLHIPFGEPGGPVLQQIREFDPLPNQPRSNPSWLPPPPTQPSSAVTSATVVTSTAARVTPPHVGPPTSTMVTAPASTPVSRPLPPPPLSVTLLAQGPTSAIQMPWDQLFSQYPRYSRNAPLHATSGAAVHSSPTSWHIPAEYLLSTSPSQPSRNVQPPRPGAQQHL